MTQDKTTAIYVRTGVHSRSTDQSLAAQEQACRSYASTLGWCVSNVYADTGIAGMGRDRPSPNGLLAAARDGTVERVLITRPTRLSRRPADVRAILGEMEKLGMVCVSMQQPVCAPGPATKPVEK